MIRDNNNRFICYRKPKLQINFLIGLVSYPISPVRYKIQHKPPGETQHLSEFAETNFCNCLKAGIWVKSNRIDRLISFSVSSVIKNSTRKILVRFGFQLVRVYFEFLSKFWYKSIWEKTRNPIGSAEPNWKPNQV